MSKGRLVIISGPSGSGKDTILKKVLKSLPELKFSISSVTRPMREGEVEGEKYNFVSREYFEHMIKND
ncbi:MAG: guanylate kinase, partial [Clostridia bacterium]|nr:guanylate kinase [Clostridia bacterium]